VTVHWTREVADFLQFVCVAKTHAIILWSLRDIKKGDAITVKYHESWKKYAPDVPCGCASCVPPVSSSVALGNEDGREEEDDCGQVDHGNENGDVSERERGEIRVRKRLPRRRGAGVKTARKKRYDLGRAQNEPDALDE
jgi:hypothetical protein